MNTNVNVLFYSRQCRLCANTMNLLQNEDLLQNFKLVCVDGQLDTLPAFITEVPTLIVSNNKQPLTGQNIFKWIESIKFLRQQKAENNNKRIAEYNINKQNHTNGPLAYLTSEMDGFSDTFAYTTCDNAIPHRFYECTNDNKENIFTAPEQKIKINDDVLNKKLKDFAAMRKEQDENITGIIQQQIQAKLAEKNIKCG